MKRGFVLVILTLIATAMFLAGCGSSAPQEVEVTRVVEIPVEVTRVVEVEKAVEVEVTRVVEVPVEVEVTRLIKPTSTPRPVPTATPAGGTSSKPLPAGVPAAMTLSNRDGSYSIKFTVSQIIRGDEAWQIAASANRFNDPPTEGWEYILIYVDVEYVKGENTLEMNDYDLAIVTKGRVIDKLTDNAFIAGLDPTFDLNLLPGGNGGGWAYFQVLADDDKPMLVVGGPTGVFFDLSQPPPSES